MAIKRKFAFEDTPTPDMQEDFFRTPKHLKLIPFPNAVTNEDSPMTDAESYLHDQVHTRIHSNASTTSTSSAYSPSEPPSVNYPSFEIYPATPDNSQMTEDNVQPNANVGLIQPKSGFSHHGAGCTTIPRLRVACSTSVNGQRRSMYTLCESCGAISMVECD